jgi:hypothetical protein
VQQSVESLTPGIVEMPGQPVIVRTDESTRDFEHMLVLVNGRELLLRNYAPVICIWSGVMLLLFTGFSGLLIWTSIEFDKFRVTGQTCDTPLDTWFIVVVIKITLNILIFKRKWFMPFFCGYSPDSELDSRPLRVRVYLCFQWGFTFCWQFFGLICVFTAQTCVHTAPGFYRAVRALCLYGAVFSVLCGFTELALLRLDRASRRRFAFRLIPERAISLAAPEGTVDACKELSFGVNWELARDCPICLTEFAGSEVIRQTSCQHVFHDNCLRGFSQLVA